MTFFGETEHFSGKNGALRWSILVGKQKHNVQKPNTYTWTTLPDFLGVSWILNQSPTLLYMHGSLNLLDNIDFWAFMCFSLEFSPVFPFFGSWHGFVLCAWFYEKFSDQNVNKWVARFIKIILLSLMFLLGNVNDFTVGSEGWQSRQRWELFTFCRITMLALVHNV